MKRSLMCLLAVVLAAGCGNPEKPAPEAVEQAPVPVTNMTVKVSTMQKEWEGEGPAESQDTGHVVRVFYLRN
jgi:hypothetical protein